jgi:hypothetical protein
VLTNTNPALLGNAPEKSGVSEDLPQALEALRSLSVDHDLSYPGSSGRPAKARQGGWRSTRCLSPDLRGDGVHGAIELARQGRSLNVMVTYRPPEGLSDAEAKRWINLRHGRIGQTLNRRGHAFIGLKVFEKRPGYRLHAHGLYHVAKRCMDVIERAVDVFERRPRRGQKGDAPMHARPSNADGVDYVLKQRRWAGPDIESRRFHPLRYQRGAAIVGVRLSFTKEAKAIIWPTPRTVAEPVAHTLAIGQPLERKAA